MSFYQKHLFFCVNQKDSGKKCCADANAMDICRYAKQRVKELNLPVECSVRVSSSGCLGRCALGPCLVIYPQGAWYTYQNQDDVELIIQEELCFNRNVKHLLILDAPSC